MGIIMIAVLLLVGCNNGGTSWQPYSSGSPAAGSVNSPAANPSDYVKTYTDETHKKIQYGKLLINFPNYHLVFNTRSENVEIFQFDLDSLRFGPEGRRIIKVQAMDFHNAKGIISDLGDMFPDYEQIRIYNNSNVTDPAIIGLYCAMKSDLSYYVVCYRDACYLIESNSPILYLNLSKNEPNYKVYRQKIECADAYITKVTETVTYNKDEFEKAKYEIVQGKDGAKYSAELSRDEESQYHFTLKNEKAQNLLMLSTYGQTYNVINFLDVNMDGYADIQFLEEPGTFNNSYALYVWDESAKNFEKVKCEEMLSYFEVNDGCLRNWQKADADSGVIQTLVWDKNTLVKISEEPYQAD